MKERSSVIAIVVVLAICCLGAYVAVTGYFNSQPSSNPLNTSGVMATPVVTVLPTETTAPTKPAVVAPVVPPTAVAVPSPLGALQTITAALPIPVAPTVAPRATQPPVAVASPMPTAPAQPACANSPFCSAGGPPDSTLGPGGNECPSNYIFGRVVDTAGKGIPNVTIRFRDPTGIAANTTTKGAPDPAGMYNIPTGQPGSEWVVWLEINGNQASPQVKLITQRYPGSGTCPTRLEFIQQK